MNGGKGVNESGGAAIPVRPRNHGVDQWHTPFT
jgi:hypothetical protein